MHAILLTLLALLPARPHAHGSALHCSRRAIWRQRHEQLYTAALEKTHGHASEAFVTDVLLLDSAVADDAGLKAFWTQRAAGLQARECGTAARTVSAEIEVKQGKATARSERSWMIIS